MSEQLYDMPLDDSGYSEYTVEDFFREAEQVGKHLSGDKYSIHWTLLRNETLPIDYRINVAFEDPYGDFRRSEILEYNNR